MRENLTKIPDEIRDEAESFGKKTETPFGKAKTVVGPIESGATVVSTPHKMRERASSEQFIKVEQLTPEQQRLIDVTRVFEERLDPNEYNPTIINKLKDLRSAVKPNGEIPLGLAKTDKSEKTNTALILGLEPGDEGFYKPRSGENFFGGKDIRGIEQGEAYLREWLCHNVEMNLELGLVPPTVIRTNGFGIGSVQEWVEGINEADAIGSSYQSARSAEIKSKKAAGTLRPEEEVDDLSLYWEGIEQSANRDQLKALAVFDFLTQNSDRHPGNFGIMNNGDVVGFDNGLTFPDDHHKALWIDIAGHALKRGSGNSPTFLIDKLGGENIPESVIGKLKWFQETPQRQEKLQEAMVLSLGSEKGAKAWKDFQFRIKHLLSTKKIPEAMYLY